MRTIFKLPAALLFVFITVIGFQNCVKDKCTQRFTMLIPVYKTPEAVRANIKSNAPREIERPGKIYIKGNYIFLNELDKGIHVIDNSNKQAPQRVAFIDIPGNIDIAVKGDILYADLYTDLVTIDISNPQNITVKKITDNVFPERLWERGFKADTSLVITDWVRKDTVVESYCGGNAGIFGGGGRKSSDVMIFASGGIAGSSSGGGQSVSPVGIGGSMARFTIINNYMYAVSNSALKVISVADAANPVFSNLVNIGWGIETIYPFKNRLFVGSNSGMFIYDVSSPNNPVQLGRFEHVRSCDPVIADDNYAYVTLRSGTACFGFINQLDVVDISNLNAPVLSKTYQLTNPHGLAKDGSQLIICDGKDGVKFFDAASPAINVTLRKKISGPEAIDVIAFGGWALVMARDGIYQYSYDNAYNVTELSRLTIK